MQGIREGRFNNELGGELSLSGSEGSELTGISLEREREYGPEMNRKQGPPKLKGQRGQLLHRSLGHPVCVEGEG